MAYVVSLWNIYEKKPVSGSVSTRTEAFSIAGKTAARLIEKYIKKTDKDWLVICIDEVPSDKQMRRYWGVIF